jgi:hypothetical protein
MGSVMAVDEKLGGEPPGADSTRVPLLAVTLHVQHEVGLVGEAVEADRTVEPGRRVVVRPKVHPHPP